MNPTIKKHYSRGYAAGYEDGKEIMKIPAQLLLAFVASLGVIVALVITGVFPK